VSAVYFDRVRETTTTTGTGTFTLAGAATGFRAFSSVYTAATQIVYYCATDGTNWEVGQGTYTLSGTTLSRTTVLSSSNAGALVNFTAASTQVFATIPARMSNQIFTLNVVDFGATGNGSTDDTSAINAAIAAANGFLALSGTQRGVRVWFPAGIYLVSAALTVINGNGIRLCGEGRGASTILVTALTGDIISFTSGNEYVEVSDLQFYASVTRTSGSFINTNGANDVKICDFVMSGAFWGVNVSGSSIKVVIERGVISSSVSPSGVGIMVNNGAAGDTYIGPRIIMSNSSGARPIAGIEIVQTGHTQITGVNITNCTAGLIITPGASQGVKYVWVTDSLFDSCGSYALEIDPQVNAATCTVQSCRFQSSWFSGTAAGVGISLQAAGSSSIVDDIVFDNCRVLNNWDYGVQITFGTNVCISNSTIAGNGQATTNTWDGINVSAGITDFRIIGNRIGPVGTATNTQRYGVYINAGASTRFIVRNNDLRGNGNGAGTGGAFSNNTTYSATTIFDVGDNLGGPLAGRAMVAASSAINTTETVLVSAPAGSNGINPGTVYRIILAGTCTSTVANASTFTIRLGIAGTTADSSIATFTCTATASGTTIPFKIEIILVFRTVGTSGTVSGYMMVIDGATAGTGTGIAGFSASTSQVATTAAANTTLNDLVLSCTYKAANTTTTCTFQQGQIALDVAA
jgi:hypothetical protein